MENILVYFIYIDVDSNWKNIISGQIKTLEKYGLLAKNKVYIHLTDAHHLETSLSFVKNICPQAIISTSEINEFEYQPIRLIHHLAHQYPNAIMMYLHTKGMSYKTQKRVPIEKSLLRNTFKNWQETIHLLKTNPDINKAGLFPYYEGKHIWFNFWYAKASYIQQLEKPIIAKDRYYYEHWLGKVVDKKYPFNDSLCIYTGKTNNGYNVEDTCKLMKSIYRKEHWFYFFLKEKKRETKRFLINIKYNYFVPSKK